MNDFWKGAIAGAVYYVIAYLVGAAVMLFLFVAVNLLFGVRANEIINGAGAESAGVVMLLFGVALAGGFLGFRIKRFKELA